MAEGELIGGDLYSWGTPPIPPAGSILQLFFSGLIPSRFFSISRPLHPAHLCSVIPH